MILLSFTVRNHRSLRDEVTVDFVRPSLRTLRPKDGEDWGAYVYPVAGIFGANATGKSAILTALAYAFAAIQDSSTAWQAAKVMLREPFALDPVSAEAASSYELDFVHEGRRHLYGFEVDAKGIVREWLRDFPSRRWRTLIERDRETGTLKLHSSIRSVGENTRRELILSRALLLEHPQLAPIARDLVRSFDVVWVRDADRVRRLESIADSLMDGSLTFADIVTLLQVADIGIDDVTVHEESLPQHLLKALREFQEKLSKGDDGGSTSSGVEPAPAPLAEPDDDESDAVVRNLLFTHKGAAEGRPPFSIEQESDGTIAWLSLVVPALEALWHGGLYCVDEIDSSLHPHMLDLLLGLFVEPETNPKGAQLLFTSHETYILSSLSEIRLEPEQVWFTDKSADGATELFCLADFTRHKDANVAKRYLEGRYGGTPRLAPGALAALVRAKAS